MESSRVYDPKKKFLYNQIKEERGDDSEHPKGDIGESLHTLVIVKRGRMIKVQSQLKNNNNIVTDDAKTGGHEQIQPTKRKKGVGNL